MSEKSAIEWTDATWNPVRGCTKVSPGCAHCYAEVFAERFRGVPGHPYEQGFDLRLVPEKLTEPLSWRKPRRVFVNSMSDLFQEGVPDSYIDQVFAVMALAHLHTFQVLTKRPERMRAYVERLAATARAEYRDWPKLLDDQLPWLIELLGTDRMQALCEVPDVSSEWPLPNVWLGVSVENQHFVDERIPLLLQTPAAVRFISAEPLLSSIGIAHWLAPRQSRDTPGWAVAPETRLDWVIVGGESGPGARPFDVAWARSIIAQCKAACVPCFVKQLGAHVRGSLKGGLVDRWEMPNGEWRQLPIITTPAAATWVTETRRDAIGGRFFDKKGGDMAEWPEDLRVREFP